MNSIPCLDAIIIVLLKCNNSGSTGLQGEKHFPVACALYSRLYKSALCSPLLLAVRIAYVAICSSHHLWLPPMSHRGTHVTTFTRGALHHFVDVGVRAPGVRPWL